MTRKFCFFLLKKISFKKQATNNFISTIASIFLERWQPLSLVQNVPLWKQNVNYRVHKSPPPPFHWTSTWARRIRTIPPILSSPMKFLRLTSCTHPLIPTNAFQCSRLIHPMQFMHVLWRHCQLLRLHSVGDWWKNEYRALVEWCWQQITEVIAAKPVPVSLSHTNWSVIETGPPQGNTGEYPHGPQLFPSEVRETKYKVPHYIYFFTISIASPFGFWYPPAFQTLSSHFFFSWQWEWDAEFTQTLSNSYTYLITLHFKPLGD